MTVTTTPRAGVTRWSDPNDPFTRAQMDASHASIEALMAIDVQDLLANRPAPGTRGRFFSESAASAGLPGTTWRDDGATWRSVGSRVVAASSTDIGKIVRGAASQSADLQQWQDSAGTVLTRIGSGGGLAVGGGATFTPPAANAIPLTAKGFASQSVSLQEWQSSTGSAVARVNSGGTIGASGFYTIGQETALGGFSLGIVPFSNANVAAVIRGAASQVAHLQDWQNSAGTVLTGIDAAGYLATYPYRTNWSVGWLGITGTTTWSRITRIGSYVHAEAQISITSSPGSVGLNLPYNAAATGANPSIVGQGFYRNGAAAGHYAIATNSGQPSVAYFYPGGGGGGELWNPGWSAGYISVKLDYFTDDSI